MYGVNVFSDLTPEEFKSMLACLFRDLSHLTQEEYVRVKFFLIWLLHTCKWNRFTLRLKTLSCFTFWLASFPGSPHMGMFGLQTTESWVGPGNFGTGDGSQTVVKVSHFRSATENHLW